MITRAVGTEPDVDVDTFTVEARAGDVYLLCSDGLTDMVGEDEILQAFQASGGDLDRTAARAGRRGEQGRRRGQHHRGPVLGRRSAAEDAVGDTRELPAVGLDGAPEPDDEDTLSGLEGVPAVDTAVISAEDVRRELAQPHVEPEAGPPTPDEARRRGAGKGGRWIAVLLLVLALAVIAALVVWGLLR